MTEQAFAKSRDALKSKQKQLQRLDKGNKRLEDSSLNQEEIDPLFNWRVMGIHSPQELINTLWFNNSLYHSNWEEENNSSLGEMSSKTEAVLVKNISNTHLEDTKTRAGDKSLNKGSLKPRGMSENLAVPAERNRIQSAYKLRET